MFNYDYDPEDSDVGDGSYDPGPSDADTGTGTPLGDGDDDGETDGGVGRGDDGALRWLAVPADDWDDAPGDPPRTVDRGDVVAEELENGVVVRRAGERSTYLYSDRTVEDERKREGADEE